MLQNFRRISVFLLAVCLLLSVSACKKQVSTAEDYPDAHILQLDEHSAKLDGADVEEFDYTWHCDLTAVHDEEKNAPAEYHTGTKPATSAAAYIDSDLPYFPKLSENSFELLNYDGEREWITYYQDGEHDAYLFGTLPYLNAQLPTQMMHSETEAAENRVLHITTPGTYILQGTWKGQIRVDLGDRDSSFTDENAKVTLVLNGADIDCSVSAGILFYSVYECDNGWEDRATYSEKVSTENAGATVVIADDTENSVSGENVFRMLKPVYKDDTSTDPVPVQKKLRKTDGALYSYSSMNIEGGRNGTGSLTVHSGFEGIDSELHLTFLGGTITVDSDDDGINVNEDGVSVVSFLGGSVNLNPAKGAEGDGVDSNGFVVIDGGTLSINGVRPPDSALDSECGIFYESGTVIIDGAEQTYHAGTSFREFGMENGRPEGNDPFGQTPPDMGHQGMTPPDGMQQEFDLAKFKEQVAALPDNATLDDVMALLGMGMQQGGQPQFGETPPQKP